MRGAVSAADAEILDNEAVAPEHFVVALAAPEMAASALPGQFAMLRVRSTFDPLLPRAFSFYRADAAAGRVEFLYRVIGKGTRLLAAQRPGARLHLWGPLGRGFERPAGDALLIGGGVGVPPLVCLAGIAAREGWLAEGSRLHACFGFATAAFVVGEERLVAAGVPLEIATDDGTRGHHGFVTDLLREHLRQATVSGERVAGPSGSHVAPGSRPANAALAVDGSIQRSARRRRSTAGQEPGATDLARDTLQGPDTRLPTAPARRLPLTVYACGPHPMLAAVARLCEEFGAASQLALEAPMACGVGACIGCTVPRRGGGYARVCTDGPVFAAEQIAWE